MGFASVLQGLKAAGEGLSAHQHASLQEMPTGGFGLPAALLRPQRARSALRMLLTLVLWATLTGPTLASPLGLEASIQSHCSSFPFPTSSLDVFAT